MNSLAESARYHDDHLRAIDAWFAQVSIRIVLATTMHTVLTIANPL